MKTLAFRTALVSVFAFCLSAANRLITAALTVPGATPGSLGAGELKRAYLIATGAASVVGGLVLAARYLAGDPTFINAESPLIVAWLASKGLVGVPPSLVAAVLTFGLTHLAALLALKKQGCPPVPPLVVHATQMVTSVSQEAIAISPAIADEDLLARHWIELAGELNALQRAYEWLRVFYSSSNLAFFDYFIGGKLTRRLRLDPKYHGSESRDEFDSVAADIRKRLLLPVRVRIVPGSCSSPD